MNWEEKIKAALKKAGLSESLWAFIKVEKEEDIAAAVKELQSVMDKRATDAVKTHEQKLKDESEAARKKAEEEEAAKKKKEGEAKNPPSELEKQLAALTDTVTKLAGTVTEMATKSSKAEKEGTALKALQEAKLPENMLRYVNLDDVAGSVEALKKDFGDFAQKQIDDKLATQGRPAQGGTGAVEDSTVVSFAKTRNKNSSGVEAPIPGKIPTGNSKEGESK